MCITKKFSGKTWSSFGQAIKVRKHSFYYIFSSTILETFTLEYLLVLSPQIKLITKDSNINGHT